MPEPIICNHCGQKMENDLCRRVEELERANAALEARVRNLETYAGICDPLPADQGERL